MTKYQQFLKEAKIISEEEFNKVVNEFSNIDFNSLNFDLFDEDFSLENVVRVFIESLLQDYSCVWLDGFNFDEKTISLEDVNDLEDLESIKQKLSDWTITNYNELKEEFIEEEKENKKYAEYQKKMNIINNIIDNISIEELENFAKQYDNKN